MAYQREVRLGLVLYGGVSLAVYENGIAQELYRAIRGKGVYGLIAKLIDSDIVIDIISGTSAGGVNGVMLACALANKRQFAPSADLWRNQGDIQALLRKQRDPDGSSVLDSTYYQDKLADCFGSALTPDPKAPEIGELDLFVTSTDANGRISTVFDDLGHAIDIKSHRALFKLSYRKVRKNDLDAPPTELAKLSRMTSSFPVAFQPVLVNKTESNFFRWGKLRDSAVYLDGGILNNKPFTSTIDAIETRTATCEVERFLIYVEPKPEQFAPSPAAPSAPTMAQAAFSSLVSIPSYQSIAGDLEAIEAHNERAGRLVQILESLPPAPETDAKCLQAAGVLADESDRCDRSAYYAARLIELRDKVVECILNDKNGRGYFPPQETKTAPTDYAASPNGSNAPPDRRRSGRILVQSFDYWPGDWHFTLTQYDVFFRMRRTKHLLNTLMRTVKAGSPVPKEAWDIVNHSFKLYEMARWALISWVNQWDFDWMSLSAEYPLLDTQPLQEQQETLTTISVEVWKQVEGRLQDLLMAGIPLPADRSPASRETFYKRLCTHLDGAGPSRNSETNLLYAIDADFKASLNSLSESDDPSMIRVATLLRNEFCRFLEVDRQLFLLQVGSGFESMDMIRVVRFSPLDAQRCLSKGKVEDKVRGSALASFGGFFKKSWRANDIMMGRLDAACLMVECLLTKERLAALAPQRSSAGISVTPTELLEYFPNLGPNASKLAKTINGYLASSANASTDDWNDLINEIVCAAHDEIQREEWPKVVACSIEQEYDWGRYRRNTATPASPFNLKNLVWNRAKARPDEVLVQVAAQAIAAGTIPPLAPGSVASGSFLDQMPDTILDELGALAAIRLGKGLLASISNQDAREKVASNAFFKYPFNWIAPIFYNWARMRRTQPDMVIIFNTAIPVFCLTFLALDVLLGFLGVHCFSYRTWGLLVVPPLVLLWVWARLFRR
jgi:patatin-related protein